MLRLEEDILAGAIALDTTPAAFTFTDQSGVALSSTRTSNTITVSGLTTGVSVAVSVSGGQYSKNGGGYTSSAGTAQNGDTFAVQHTSSGSHSTAVNTTLTIGGVSDTFTSTTAAFSPVTNDYTGGSGTEVVPAGATSLTISMNGRGGNGSANTSPGPPGTGGGGGGESTRTVSVSAGQSFSWAFDGSGNATVSSASPSVSMTANAGQLGSAGGGGGTASGGTTNTTGGAGSQPTGGSSPNGGGIQTTLGADGNFPGGGGAGHTLGNTPGSGALGRIRFAFT